MYHFGYFTAMKYILCHMACFTRIYILFSAYVLAVRTLGVHQDFMNEHVAHVVLSWGV